MYLYAYEYIFVHTPYIDGMQALSKRMMEWGRNETRDSHVFLYAIIENAVCQDLFSTLFLLRKSSHEKR